MEEASRLLARARSVVVVTGAGVSAESRIPTFRDAMTGLWASFDPQRLATPEAFARDPEMVSRWYDWRRQKCAEAIPNPGHEAISAMERALVARGADFLLVTQNVDGLHRRAGSRNVIEIHGTLATWRCTRTGEEYSELPVPLPAYPCPSPAGGLLRPCVVWFGEALPEAGVRRAVEACGRATLFFSIGTSAQVYPVAGFADVAAGAGAKIIEVNPEETPLSPRADVVIRACSAAALPQIVAGAFPGSAGADR
ncbi:MAG: NAD-dependent deacylase [Phycisphaerales bacterium]|nr:NAD-dependent deacylase [Phycisphaerales bacterium]